MAWCFGLVWLRICSAPAASRAVCLWFPPTHMSRQQDDGLPEGFSEADLLTLGLQGLDPKITKVSAWTTDEGGAVIINLEGEFAHEHRDPIREFLTMVIERHSSVTLDVSKTTFGDSTFLSNLVVANKLARARGVQLRFKLGDSGSRMSRALALTSFNTVFEIEVEAHPPPADDA